MPVLTLQDATKSLPLLAEVDRILELYAEAGRRYCACLEESAAIRGATREALVANGHKIAAACQRARDKVSVGVVEMREVAERGAHAAAESAKHIESVEIPDFV